MELQKQPVHCLNCRNTMPLPETRAGDGFGSCSSCGSSELIFPVLMHKAYHHDEDTMRVAK